MVVLISLIAILSVYLWLMWMGIIPDGHKRNNQVVHRGKTLLVADDLRVPGEKLALFSGIVLISFVFLILMRITFGVVLVFVVYSVVMIKVRQGQLLGQSLRVTEHQLPEIYAVAQLAAERLAMPMPDLFVIQDPIINAYAIGFLGRKSVVLHSATIDAMDTDELCSIIGHEFCHIKCDHTQWLVFTNLSQIINLPIISHIVGFVLAKWSRQAEYTCDRGGLIACRSLNASVKALTKATVGKQIFDRMDFQNFYEQKETVSDDKVARYSELFADHPYIVSRITALNNFIKSDVYRSFTEAESSSNSEE